MRIQEVPAICRLAIAVSVAVTAPLAASESGEVAPPPFSSSVPSGIPSVDDYSAREDEPERSESSNEPIVGERVFPRNRYESPSDPLTGSRSIYWPPFSDSPRSQRAWPPPSWVATEPSSADVLDADRLGPPITNGDSGETRSDDYHVFQLVSEQPSSADIANYDEWQLLPRGLMYQSYLAGPREPRFGYVWLYDTANDTWVNDAAIGGRFGILRYGDRDPFLPEGWQLDLEGAAFPRLAETSLDLIATDYRVGLPLTGRQGPLQWKLAYYHLSSHIGDEYLLNTAPDFDRINFSRNAVVAGLGYFLTPDVRLYAEAGYGFLNDGGNQPWEFQFGAEYRPFVPTGWRGAPFVATNVHLREEVDFGGSFNFMAGWAWQGSDSSYLLRAGLQYFNGHSSQFEFLGDSEQLLGLGLWLDL